MSSSNVSNFIQLTESSQICHFVKLLQNLPIAIKLSVIFLSKNIETTLVGWLAQLAERRSLAGELTLFYPRPVADG